MMNNQDLSSNMNSYHGKISNHCRLLREEHISSGEWLSLSKITYLDQHGIPRVWEGTTRLTRIEAGKVDAVGVLALYRRLLHFDCLLLVKQYRPAMDAYTIEIPSGLVDDNEAPDVSALRELKECTGFTGAIKKIGPVMAMDPGASNCSMRLVTLEVNGDDPDNVFMNNAVDNGRFKEPLLIPVAELLDKLSAFASAGFIIDSRIYPFAIGLAMGNTSRKTKIPTTLVS